MKTKIIFFTLSIMSFFSGYIIANNPENPADKIKDSKSEIQSELSELDNVDQFIGNEFDFNRLSSEQPEMVKSVKLSSDMTFAAAGGERPPLGIPGFLWGFCLGLIGMLIVYLAMSEGPDRKKQVTNALYGCLAWTALYLILILTGAIKVASAEPKVIESVGRILTV
jgi:hypothetical protein